MRKMKNKFDFSIPQRQSLIGVVVLFANTAQKSVRALFPLFLVFLFKKDENNEIIIYVAIVLIIVLIAIIAFLRYWFFKFYIDKDLQEFVIESGIFNKTKTAIQLQKIQKVDINQSLIQRIFNVHKLEIDTAGSDKKEASISAISHEMALDLKSHLVENAEFYGNKVTSDELVTENQPKNFITIGLPSLIKIGLTANYVASFAYLVLFFSTISDNLRQIGKERLIDENIDKLDKFPITTVLLVFFGLIIVLILVINLFSTVIKYFNFTIKKDKNTFVLSYGLINLKNTIINPEKVQIIKLSQNYFQKRLNVNTIEIKQASSSEGSKKKDKTKIPGCNSLEKNEILKLLIQQLPSKENEVVPNIRKLLLSVFFLILIPVCVGLLVNSFYNRLSVIEAIVVTLVYVLLVGIINWFSFKNYRLFPSKDFIVKQSGAWDIDQEIIEPHKIQAIKTSQFFWQKLTNIGSVVLYTAGGSISFSTANYTTIKKLTNYWLYQVEVSHKNWI